MKTIQRVLAASMSIFITTAALGQLNLGLQSTTNAAVNAAVNPGFVVQSTRSIANAAHGTTSAVVGKTMELKSTGTGAISGVATTKVEAGHLTKADVSQTSALSTSGQNTNVVGTGEANLGLATESNPVIQSKIEKNVSVEVKAESRATVRGQ